MTNNVKHDVLHVQCSMCEAENDFPERWPLIKLSNVALTGSSGLIDAPDILRRLRNEIDSAVPQPKIACGFLVS